MRIYVRSRVKFKDVNNFVSHPIQRLVNNFECLWRWWEILVWMSEDFRTIWTSSKTLYHVNSKISTQSQHIRLLIDVHVFDLNSLRWKSQVYLFRINWLISWAEHKRQVSWNAGSVSCLTSFRWKLAKIVLQKFKLIYARLDHTCAEWFHKSRGLFFGWQIFLISFLINT